MVRLCTAADIDQMVELAYRKNNEEAHYSAFCYTRRDKIEEEFTGSIASEDCILIGYFSGNTLQGLLTGFIDYDRRSVDCSGPFAEGDFNEISKQMFDLMKSQLPAPMKYIYYFGSKNEDCLSFLQMIGAKDQGNEYILYLQREQFIPFKAPVQAVPLQTEQQEQFIKLHDAIFPEVYISGKGIIKSLGADRQVLCIMEGLEIIAYSVLKTYKRHNKATAEIVAVAEKHRHRGYGRIVLNQLVQKALEDKTIDAVDLVVDKVNENALSLYLSMGFKVERENYSYCINT